MSDWAPIHEGLAEIDRRRERTVEEERLRRLGRARRLAGNGHLNPIRRLLVAAKSTAPGHHYNPQPVENAISPQVVRSTCSCGWYARRTYFGDRPAKTAWDGHVKKVSRA